MKGELQRHRTVRTKESLSSTTTRLMVFKLVVAASKTWRRLKGTNQLPKVQIQRRRRGHPHAGKPRRRSPRHPKSRIARVGGEEPRGREAPPDPDSNDVRARHHQRQLLCPDFLLHDPRHEQGLVFGHGGAVRVACELHAEHCDPGQENEGHGRNEGWRYEGNESDVRRAALGWRTAAVTHLTLVRLARLQSRRNRRSISGWHAVLESRTPIRICSGHRLSVAVFEADWTKGSRERRVHFSHSRVSEPNLNKCVRRAKRS